MLRSQFEEDLENCWFYAMGQSALANQSYSACLCYAWPWFGKEVIEDDAEVNEYEVKLERNRLKWLPYNNLFHKTNAVLTVLKAVSDVERMGDHAVSIAEATIRMKEATHPFCWRRNQRWDATWKRLRRSSSSLSQRFCGSSLRGSSDGWKIKPLRSSIHWLGYKKKLGKILKLSLQAVITQVLLC